MPVFRNVLQHSLWNSCIQWQMSANHSIFGRMFPHFKSLSDFLFVIEVITFFFQSYFDGFRSTADSERDGWSYRHDTARTSSTDADSVALVATFRRRCLLPLHIVDADHQLSWSCCHHRAGGRWVAATRQFHWWSVASTGLSWLLISYICMVCTGALSSSSLAAILNTWRLSLCELLILILYKKSRNKRAWIQLKLYNAMTVKHKKDTNWQINAWKH